MWFIAQAKVMVVKIRVASKTKGDIPQILELPEATSFIKEYTQRGWLAAINGQIGGTKFLQDGDEVKLYPAVAGG